MTKKVLCQKLTGDKSGKFSR